LSVSIKTIGEWIQVKRFEKNMTPGHLATKMGIARSLICSWEAGASQPDSHQLKGLMHFFGSDSSLPNRQNE
jgi:transcriptional regulator with XRE-family HTH domain